MSSNEITLDFLSGWDTNALMDPISRNVTPVWSRILEAAAESKESISRERNSRSRNCRVVSSNFFQALFASNLLFRDETS
jgi:hypothetical protein